MVNKLRGGLKVAAVKARNTRPLRPFYKTNPICWRSLSGLKQTTAEPYSSADIGSRLFCGDAVHGAHLQIVLDFNKVVSTRVIGLFGSSAGT